MTRAQKFQWFLEKGIITRGWELPPGFTASAALHALSVLGQRFEIVRTVFDVVDGRIQQVVDPPGYQPALPELDLDTDVSPLVDDLRHAFDMTSRATTGQRPVQFSLIRVGGHPKWLIMVADHVALDIDAADRVQAALAEITSERETSVDGDRHPGPLELAEHEASDRGRAERSRARRFLAGHFESAPEPTFSPASATASHYFRASLAFPDGPDTLAMIWRRWQVSPSAAVLAAFGMAVSSWTGTDRHSVNLSVSNRHSEFLNSIVGATAQRTPVQLAGCTTTFSAAATAATHALLVAMRHGRYDPLDLLEARIRVGHRRGIDLAPDLAYNFAIPPGTWKDWLTAVPRENNGPPVEESASWRATSEKRYEYRASLSVKLTSTSIPVVQLHGDSTALSAEDSQTLLTTILALLRQAATGVDASIEDVWPGMPARIAGPCPAEAEPPATCCTGARTDDDAESAHRPGRTDAEQAVQVAFATTNANDAHPDKCYVCSGGQLELFPRFQQMLADRGYRGVTFDDAVRGVPLWLLASDLER